MTALQSALSLARQGFHIFPLQAGTKLPVHKGWQLKATRDPAQIERWFRDKDSNIGIFTGKFGQDAALLVIDVDRKGEKDGNRALLRHELDGDDVPPTFESATPTGGRHLVYRVGAAVRQGVDVLGAGLDVRSHGGYIVAPGSKVEAGEYFIDRPGKPVDAPQWLIDACGMPRGKAVDRTPLAGVDPERAVKRATFYLENEAPEAIEGAGGDNTTFQVAAKLKDLGVSPDTAVELMLEHWFDGCGWTPDELATKVRNAYRYGENPPGADAPEALFDAVEEPVTAVRNPLKALNDEYALVLNGGEASVYHERRLENGQRKIDSMKGGSFELVLKDRKFDGKPLSAKWLSWPGRRFYRGGVNFCPMQDPGPDVLNLWGGFAVEPVKGDWSLFRAHIRDVICSGDAKLDAYVMGWLAHMVQRPHEPAGVALVLRGGQGTGKSTFGEIVGAMLGEHYVHIYSRQQLTGNFNSHLACKVMILADEAYFAGNLADGPVLKALLTESTMLKENKGKDIVRVRNCAHVVMASNDDWVVPADHDQRRFCVLDVAGLRRNDRSYFEQMRAQMKRGGTAAMLHDLSALDIAGFDIGNFPATDAGTDQKVASLRGPMYWLHDALCQGRIIDLPWEASGVQVSKRQAYADYVRRAQSECRDHRPVGRPAFWSRIKAVFSSPLTESNLRLAGEVERDRAVTFPPLAEAREAFGMHLDGRHLLWEDG
ncbi:MULTISPECIES: bifunctional DNA primase/polymerase [Dyella]|uniref:DNA primase/polymerase bifunctional N-terminal domain-containing protein n=2 Tax=Dyella TaxID=231454 RepID=A0A4R0Z074_9GAMM|nr:MULTISPECIES: bifunctional DNA primase/polymerase [Dyella]TBR39263.1 hypothetical protein EYV96_03285 [Dyella terrae]TCI13149.1 hypothetical protein EZM97_07580 [Dyella soli]